MKKNPANQESGALVVVKQSLPATVSSAFTDEEMAEFNHILRRSLGSDREIHLVGRFLTRAVGLGLGVPAVACLTAGALPWAIGLGSVTLGCAYLGTIISKSLRTNFNDEVQYSKYTAQGELTNKQNKFAGTQRKQILEVAESHIARGNLLNVEDLSWLVNLNASSLESASEKLAITVLQARKALACVRSGKPDAERTELKTMDPAVTFASLEIKPDIAPNRTYLREQLVKADSALSEDKIETSQKVEFSEEPKKKSVGTLRAFLEYCIPFADIPVGIEYRRATLPTLKPVELVSLKPAADFAQALAEYETQNPPLDLPAMRGWKPAARKALTHRSI